MMNHIPRDSLSILYLIWAYDSSKIREKSNAFKFSNSIIMRKEFVQQCIKFHGSSSF